jgi:AcrR family transcriptional regulator
MSGNVGEKTDRRVRRTRDTLGDALLELMQEKVFVGFWGQAVGARGGVGRSTFYAHYRDKDDLFLSDIEEFWELTAGMLTRKDADRRRLAPVKELFAHVAGARALIVALNAAGKWEEVRELGVGIFARSIEERLRRAGTGGEERKLSGQAHALAGSMFALLDWWLGRGVGMSAEEADTMFHRMAWIGGEFGLVWLRSICPAGRARWSRGASNSFGCCFAGPRRGGALSI